jgi:integrase
VFTNELGTHYAIHTFYKEYKRMVEKIGRPDARPHDLRHTCATAAIASGSDIKSVQDLMGHATAAFTLDRYAHTSEKMKQDTADRLQAYYEALRAQ